jgi:hypothetical protein
VGDKHKIYARPCLALGLKQAERERERERAHTAREEKANRPGGINKQMRLASSSLLEKSGLALCLPYIKGHTHTNTFAWGGPIPLLYFILFKPTY